MQRYPTICNKVLHSFINVLLPTYNELKKRYKYNILNKEITFNIDKNIIDPFIVKENIYVASEKNVSDLKNFIDQYIQHKKDIDILNDTFSKFIVVDQLRGGS